MHCSAIGWRSLFVGDLSNDVSEDVLSNAFNKYPTFTKARVIRDRLSGKVTLIVYSLYETKRTFRQSMAL